MNPLTLKNFAGTAAVDLCRFSHQATNQFLTHKFKTNPIIVLESTNIETIASLSAKGIGSTIIPATVAMHLDEGEYNLCPLPQDILSLDYFLAYAKERNLSPNEKDMIETFKKINIIECTQKEGWPKFSELR